MKQFIIVFFLFTCPFLYAKHENVFQKANEYYKKGNYEKAIELYTSILDEKKIHASELYFNLANAYYKSNQNTQAIYFFEKALLLSPNDEAAAFNLELANKRKTDTFKPIEPSVLQVFALQLQSWLTLSQWTYSVLLAALLVLLFGLIYLFVPNLNSKRISFYGGCTFVVVTILLFFISYFLHNFKNSYLPAIVFNEKVEVRDEPKLAAKPSLTIHEGTKVFVVEKTENWKRIKITDKIEGWISSDAVKSLD